MGFLDRIKKNKVDLSLLNYSLRIFGNPGSGKTTLTYNIINEIEKNEGIQNSSVFIMTEDGAKHIDGIPVIQPIDKATGKEKNFCETIMDVNAVVSEIIKAKQSDPENFPIKIVVFDTSTNLEKMMIRKAESDNGCSLNLIGGGYGRGNAIVNAMIFDIITKLKKVNITPWFISHGKIKQQKDKLSQDEYIVQSVDSGEGWDGVILKDVDLSFMVTRDNIIKNKRLETSERKIVFREDGLYKAVKSRFSNVPDELLLEECQEKNAVTVYNTLINAIKGQTKLNDVEFASELKKQKVEDKAKELVKIETSIAEEKENELEMYLANILEHIDIEAKKDSNWGLPWKSWIDANMTALKSMTKEQLDEVASRVGYAQ